MSTSMTLEEKIEALMENYEEIIIHNEVIKN